MHCCTVRCSSPVAEVNLSLQRSVHRFDGTTYHDDSARNRAPSQWQFCSKSCIINLLPLSNAASHQAPLSFSRPFLQHRHSYSGNDHTRLWHPTFPAEIEIRRGVGVDIVGYPCWWWSTPTSMKVHSVRRCVSTGRIFSHVREDTRRKSATQAEWRNIFRSRLRFIEAPQTSLASYLEVSSLEYMGSYLSLAVWQDGWCDPPYLIVVHNLKLEGRDVLDLTSAT
jgi:hypothetical protein